jgi:hypothetical protein
MRRIFQACDSMLSVVLEAGQFAGNELFWRHIAEQDAGRPRLNKTHPHGEGGKLDPWRQWTILGVVPTPCTECTRYGGRMERDGNARQAPGGCRWLEGLQLVEPRDHLG